MLAHSMRRRLFALFGSACFLGGSLVGCGSPVKGPPPIDASKAKQANEDDFKRAMDQVDADPNLSAADKQKLKSELEHSMKMQSNAIDGIDRAQKGNDPGPGDGQQR